MACICSPAIGKSLSRHDKKSHFYSRLEFIVAIPIMTLQHNCPDFLLASDPVRGVRNLLFEDGFNLGPVFVDNLAAFLSPAGKYFMLCFSELEPAGYGPRRIT
jgi:hypothetical protein